jgi:uncharacterized membrane protein
MTPATPAISAPSAGGRNSTAVKRLDYIDWMRGLACVLMIQAHCYDAWLNAAARKTALYRWSQEVSTMAAPIFIFLAGVSFVLVTERLRRKQTPTREIFKTAALRGAQILGLGLLLRLQEFVLGYPKSPWTDLFRVDVLNILGISIMLMAVFWRLTETARSLESSTSRKLAHDAKNSRVLTIVLSLCIAAVIALATPPLWTTHRPRFLPWMLESYINGVHIYNEPQTWLFPIFPWIGFAFVGLAFGLFIRSDFAQRKEVQALAATAAVGGAACLLSLAFDNSPAKLYAVYDYWHSSPNFFLMRCGILLLLAFAVFAWCRWGVATRGYSPFMLFGKTSLLVYWVHIEFVYGRLSILPKGRTGIPLATAGMIVIFSAMLALSAWRLRRRAKTASV